ncbi:MAG: arginine--tRNA ligase [Akkermansia muciniphila]
MSPGPAGDGMIAARMAGERRRHLHVFPVASNEDLPRAGQGNGAPTASSGADGGFLCATTTSRRWTTASIAGADSIWYVWAPRSPAFRRILHGAAAAWTGYRHIAFGSILGDDRKPFERSRGYGFLQDVLDEAIERAARVVEEKSPDMPEEGSAWRKWWPGAAMRSFSRTADGRFQLGQDVALTGRYGPYLQNSTASPSIFRKLDGGPLVGPPHSALEDAEIHLARLLARYGEVVPLVLDDCRPAHVRLPV